MTDLYPASHGFEETTDLRIPSKAPDLVPNAFEETTDLRRASFEDQSRHEDATTSIEVPRMASAPSDQEKINVAAVAIRTFGAK